MCFGAVTLKACPHLGLWNTCNSGSLPFWVATLSDCDSVESLRETLGPIFTVCTLDRTIFHDKTSNSFCFYTTRLYA